MPESNPSKPDASAKAPALHEAQQSTRSFNQAQETKDFVGLSPDQHAGAAKLTEVPKVEGYEILAVLGRGGMGIVFKARHKNLNRFVALKMIRDGSLASKEEVQRFHAEAKAAAHLDHPGIVPVYEVGKCNDQHYIAMGLVEGDSLATRLRAGPLPPREAARLVQCVAEAIAYAHERGIIHRDLKPANVLLDATGQPRVTDFGLAKKTHEADSHLTATGQVLGTPSFMPPEQATGNISAIGPAADIYSLGALLYCLVSGRPPFQAASVMDTLRQVLEQEPVSPRQLNPTVPRDLETICLKCLQKDPAKRYGSALDLAEDLRRFQAAEPILARPISVVERTWHWCRRKPAAATLVFTLVVIVLGAAGGLFWYQDQANQRTTDEALRKADATRNQELAAEKVRQGIEHARQTRAELHKVLKQPGGVQQLLNQPARWQAQIRSARADWQRASDQAAAAVDPHWVYQLETLDLELARDQTDCDLGLRLEKIRSDRAIIVEGTFGFRRGREEYSAVLAQAGLSPEPGKQKDLALLIQQSAIKDLLVAAMDDWAYLEDNAGNPELTSRLLEVARLADPDPWRDKVRDPDLWQNAPGILKLAQDAPLDKTVLGHLSPQLLDLIANLLPGGLPKENWLRTAQALHPADYWLSFDLASSLEKKNPLESAGYYRVALAIRPNNAAAYHNLGNVLKDLNDLPAAMDAYKKSLAIDSNQIIAWHNLGDVLRDQKNLPAAMDAYKNALSIDPKDAPAWNSRGLVLSDQRDLPAAIEAFKKAVASDPQFVEGWNHLGVALQDQMDLSEAIDAYQKALAIDPRHAPAWNNLGSALRDRKDLPAAIDAFKKGLAIDPNNASAWDNLGFALSDHKNLSAAIDAYTKALAIDPQHAFANRNIAHARRMLALDKKLPGVLRGDIDGAADLLALADFCGSYKERYRDAVTLYARAFAAEPSVLEREREDYAYNAACCAALAAAGKGGDADKLDAKERARLRKKAFDWLQAELTARAKLLKKEPVEAHRTMQHWQRDADLASLRDDTELGKLPADERNAFKKLWDDVDRLAKDARSMFTQIEYKGQLGGTEREHTQPVMMKAGRIYTIEMESTQFDTYLRLEDKHGKVVAENNNVSSANQNSRLVYTPPVDGAYRIVATSFEQRGVGAYTVTVREFAQ